VTSGNWPASASDKKAAKAANKRHITQRLVLDLTTGEYERVEPHYPPGGRNDNATYNAYITKTTDGGKTWKIQFQNQGNYYYNQVDCASETVCIAVAEGFSDDGSGAPGAHIHKTEDGETWKEIFVFGSDKAGSVLAVKMLSETEAWVATTCVLPAAFCCGCCTVVGDRVLQRCVLRGQGLLGGWLLQGGVLHGAAMFLCVACRMPPPSSGWAG
jgi:hypothetical protein